mmetsp:Transcript_124915/g.249427  ORF Transcript_124915/g.249427 Transcript_124915/m.249427 type:complete len:589 (+) Transcript_124915:123-1889(+)|eukprot:CAMPEP_0172672264 /NCGR_PEP_ID=MMETSP1074-20121228/11435_1 /TAXON_ID=2916 /ORGANISM="Ceratium fusus, Strain PA161109" /LENGTH=588 /DNA_ID=CAMNT_0013489425 /DNA_START=122 /DNA_END=1888 /DNA_ORIENTATION=+
MVVDFLFKYASDAASSVTQRFSPQGSGQRQMDTRTMAVFALVLLCVTAPLELSQIAFAIVGAIAYALIHATQLSTPRQKEKVDACSKTVPSCGQTSRQRGGNGANGNFRQSQMPRRPTTAAIAPGAPGGKSQPFHGASGTHSTMMSHQPRPLVAAPCRRALDGQPTTAQNWDLEVNELLTQISPTPEGDKVVQQLAQLIRRVLSQTIPEVEVLGFASGDLVRGAAFGVAVPEVDVIVSVRPSVLAARLQGRLAPRSGASAAQLDVRKLQKSAIRACTDRLVSGGGFKFRRSAFRGSEPKVTLLAPASLGIYSEAIPIDFSVNSTTPLYNAALFTECGQIEARAKSLILLVKRWAKDRGVCHAAKGHLSPYSWTLLTIFFLQVGVPDEGPLLPALEGFRLSSGLAGQPAMLGGSSVVGGGGDASAPAAADAGSSPAAATDGTEEPRPKSVDGPQKSVGELFKDFAHFYGSTFDWRNEAISVRLGRRGPPHLGLPLHIVLRDDSATEVGPNIEDPFDQRRNLGECTTSASLTRLHEELTRAADLCERGAPLAKLLEPWVPPERTFGNMEFDEDCDMQVTETSARPPATEQ